MTIDDIKSWRKAERVRLMAARERLDGATRERFRQRIDGHLWRSFPGLGAAKLASGPLGIPYPVGSELVTPTVALLPMIGWDQAGHRLGYGGGYFDRTLASLAPKPVVIGVGYELAKIDTIQPQRWDIPMDWVVTERGVYRRDPAGLAFLGEPVSGEPGTLASPVCYAAELDPGPSDTEKH